MYFVAARMITYWRGESHLSLYSIRHHTVYALLFFLCWVLAWTCLMLTWA